MRRVVLVGWAALLSFIGVAACSESNVGSAKNGVDGGDGSGGKNSGGGSQNDGGASAGGKAAVGGSSSNGGKGNAGGTSSNGGKTSAGGASSSSGGKTGAGGSAPSGPTTAKALAQKLGRDHFLIGLGNDLANDHNQDGAYTLGTSLDLHYAYLVGLKGEGGWTDWNTDGSFVNMLTDTAKSHGTVPMFTLYSMAAHGEGNMSALTDDGYMKAYWDGAVLLYKRLAMFGDPAIVQFEPDFWGYAQQQSGGDPSSKPVHVKALAPDCAALTDDLAGMGKCLVALARKYAPKVVVGFHVSGWAGDTPSIVSFMKKIGAADGDFLTTDTLDRDAGCFEAHTDPGCQRGGTTGWYWSDKDFTDHFAWVKSLTDGIGKPMLWWQTPLGVPSDTPGGTKDHYRDNRVKYFFEHIDDLIAAGGVGAAFGTGAGNQTYITTDGDQFKNAVTKYFASPVPLP